MYRFECYYPKNSDPSRSNSIEGSNPILRILGGGFKHFLFSPLFGEDYQFDEHIFEMGWFNHQLE